MFIFIVLMISSSLMLSKFLSEKIAELLIKQSTCLILFSFSNSLKLDKSKLINLNFFLLIFLAFPIDLDNPTILYFFTRVLRFGSLIHY